MSHLIIDICDMSSWRCRTSSSTSATCHRDHVALHRRHRRHAIVTMSHFIVDIGDMPP